MRLPQTDEEIDELLDRIDAKVRTALEYVFVFGIVFYGVHVAISQTAPLASYLVLVVTAVLAYGVVRAIER